MKNRIRLLRAGEIECRIGTIKENGLSLLLYKDARADMRILDETFGPTRWQRRHEVIGGNLYCTVSVWDDELRQWIGKCDVGTESNAEKEKGQASDSFKRACVSVGIGRELYTAPFIWVRSDLARIQANNGKLYTNEKFKVKEISYSESRERRGLLIIRGDGAAVFRYGALDAPKDAGSVIAENRKQNQAVDERSSVIGKELERTGIALDKVLKRYGVENIAAMSEKDYRNAVNSLRKTKDKAA